MATTLRDHDGTIEPNSSEHLVHQRNPVTNPDTAMTTGFWVDDHTNTHTSDPLGHSVREFLPVGSVSLQEPSAIVTKI